MYNCVTLSIWTHMNMAFDDHDFGLAHATHLLGEIQPHSCSISNTQLAL